LDLAVAGARAQTIAAARGRVVSAEGTLHTATAALGQTAISAPVSGRVVLRSAEPGELITPGAPILRIAQLDSVWLRVYVPEPLVERVKFGQRATVTTDAGTRFTGTVTEIAQEPEFTPKNVQTKEERVKLVFGVKITVENPDGLLKPGMPADAVIEVK
jgi:HlyD family secretion protein